jgi:hypothetical protein
MSRGDNGYWLARKNEREAAEFAQSLRPILLEFMARHGGRPRRVAEALNDANVPTRSGGKWYSTTVIRTVKYLGQSFLNDLHHAKQRAVEEQFRALTNAAGGSGN